MSTQYNKYFIPFGIFLIAFLYSSFFLQGLPLFDNDYNQWIHYAREYSLPTILWQVFNPILEDWNVDFRPTQTLVFKALFSLFEYDPSGYYYFKSLMLALFSTTYFLFLRRYLNTTSVAAFSALFLTMASSTFTSLRWVSDFVIVSEFIALLVYATFLYLETLEKPSKTKLFACLALMVILTLICDRTKANGKLIPGILFFYIVLLDWRKLKRYGFTILLMVITVLPWKVLINNPIPFLSAEPGTVKYYAWQPASLEKFRVLFGGDFEFLSLFYSGDSPISILAIIGFPLLYAFILAIAVLIFRRAPITKIDKFLIVWSVINITALMSYPTLPSHFQARYAISVLIPLIPLVLLTIYRAAQLTWNRRWIPKLLITTLVFMQLCFHGYNTFRARNGDPTVRIANAKLREYIANNFKNSWFYYMEIDVALFRPTNDGNQFFNSDNDELETVINNSLISRTNLYIISPAPLNDRTLKLEKWFPGKSESLYDIIFNNEDREYYEYGVYLYKIVDL
jgi:hypothetical protein